MRIGIDLGGTKTEVAIIDRDGEFVYRERQPTVRNSYESLLAGIVRAVDPLSKHVGSDHPVGIGIPGAIDRESGLVKNANTTLLIGKPFKEDLEKALARPVRVANDANCFALSEAVDGAGADGEVVFGVILGTGCGGGVVVHKKLLQGANSIAGEWGHNPLPAPDQTEMPGVDCYCGRKGCIETFISGTGFEKSYFKNSGISKSAAEIMELVAQGHAEAESAYLQLERRIAKSLAGMINILDPDVVVLGGGLSNIDRLYEGIPRVWGDYIFSPQVNTKLVKNVHGDSGGIRGAAWLWEQ